MVGYAVIYNLLTGVAHFRRLCGTANLARGALARKQHVVDSGR